MEDVLISFETAQLAKEKKFDLEVQAMTVGKDYPIVFNPQEESPYNWNSKAGYSIPTQSLLQKWLREKHKIILFVQHEIIDSSESAYTWAIKIYIPDGIEGTSKKRESDFWKRMDSFNHEQAWWKSYEEALEKGLQKSLKLCKNN
jgi:hypothetical protein